MAHREAASASTVSKTYPIELRQGEALGDGLRRISIGQLDRAVNALALDDLDEGIHTARKAMKRIRSILRLCRDTIGRRVYQAENGVLRESGGLLAPARDSVVVRRTLAAIKDRHQEQVEPDSLSSLDLVLEERHAEEVSAVRAAAVPAVRGELEAARLRYEGGGSDIPDEYASIEKGLRRAYRRGRKQMAVTYADPSDANFHEWRKRIKNLRYQLETLRPMGPALLATQTESLDNLGELVGRHHDLAVLRETSAGVPSFEVAEAEVLSKLVTQERILLESSAAALGDHLYNEKPRHFTTRLEKYWNNWRS